MFVRACACACKQCCVCVCLQTVLRAHMQCVCWLLLLQTSQRASETADKVSSQAQATAEETKATLSDKTQQVGAGAGAWSLWAGLRWCCVEHSCCSTAALFRCTLATRKLLLRLLNKWIGLL